MAKRRISMLIDIDLKNYSKEAHAVTITKIAGEVARYADKLMVENGYTPNKTMVTTTLHYVRHVLSDVVRKPLTRVLKSVK